MAKKVKSPQGISVILPAYNEEKNIQQMVCDCLAYLRKLGDD